MPSQKVKNVLKVSLKIAVTAVCLWYISTKIDWSHTLDLLNTSNKWWLVLATLLFTISKIIASFRLNVYFRNMSVQLTEKTNLKLYWLGMFYNLFLPGSISGDAYKVILLKRRYNYSAKLLSAAVLLDRISGVMGLGILAVIYYFILHQGSHYSGWLLAALAPGIVLYYFIVKKIFPTFLPGIWKTFWLGLLVQSIIVLCAYCIMQSINITDSQTAYIFIFLVSNVIAILPFTIGGLGAREVVFVWGSDIFHLNHAAAVYISLLYYFVIVINSFFGVRWVYKDPLE
jgi:glycosyltransferase 2 family protein